MNKYQVKLAFFEDEATGEYGVAHYNMINNPYGNSFNAFWNGIGIFHDVFEHYFEGIHKYFQNDYGCNIGGEIAAMGHLSYYNYNFYIPKRDLNPNSIYSREEQIINSTQGEIEDGIMYGNWNFGNCLMCNVPKQKVYNYNLENIIQEHWYKVKNCYPKRDKYTSNEDIEIRLNYKKSISLSKLRNLYSWGWKQAEKIAPYSKENEETLNEFIETWNNFTKRNNAKELSQWCKYMIFTITKGELKWKVDIITQDNQMLNYREI